MEEIQRILNAIKKLMSENKRIYIHLPRRCGKGYILEELRKFMEERRDCDEKEKRKAQN